MKRTRESLRLLAAVVVALLALVAVEPERGSAHAFLESSDPAANAVLPDTPQRVTMRFTEPLEKVSTSKLRLFDQLGVEVDGVESRFDTDDQYVMYLVIPARLNPGTYSVVWSTLSAADGHPARGYVPFTVGTIADIRSVVPPDIVAESTGAPQWLQTLARWVGYVGLSVAVAVWPMWLLVFRPAIAPAWQAGPRLTRRVRALGLAGVGVAIVGSLLALLVQALNAESGDGLISDLGTTLTDTRFGRIWVLRVLLFLTYAMLLIGAAWWWPRRHRALTYGTAALAAALPLPFALISHASAQTTGRSTAIAFDHLHLLSASLWMGGVILLIGALIPALRDLTPAGRRVVLGELLPRFSAIALASWAVIVLTGVYSGWLQVGSLEALRETAYGSSLTTKLLLLVPLLALAAFNLLIVSRRIKRAASGDVAHVWSKRFGVAVALEAALILAVLLVVGRLTTQAPAREELSLEQNQVDTTFALDASTAVLSLAPGRPGPNHYRLQVVGEPISPGAEAVLRLTPPGLNVSAKEVPLSRVAGNAWETHGSELSVAGDWTVEVIVREIGAFQWTSTTPVSVNAPLVGSDDGWSVPHFRPAAIVGLVMIAIGFAGFAFAWWVGRGPLRKEGSAIGAVAIALGLLLMLQARTTDASVPLTATNPIPPTEASVARGKEIYLSTCIECHGVTGRGDGPLANSFVPPAADFTTVHALAHLDGEFFNWIRGGKPPTAMPAFGDQFSDEQIWDVVNYLREIQRTSAATPVVSPEGTPFP